MTSLARPDSVGPSGGPLFILIHGWPANGETWKPQLLTLASLGFRVIAPDARGYGRSSVPKESSAYALEHHVSDMLALLTHLGRDKAVWIGHDWGAVIVWALAAQHPEKCVGVCCMAAPYHVPELGLEALLAWDYQAFQIEQPDTSAAQLRANVPNSIKLLFRSGSPESYGKPSLLASLRKSGGWFGGAPAAPDLPFETTLFKDDKPAFDRMVAEFERNGFEGPNDYYRNHEANKAYIEKAPNEGRLCYPVLFIEARRDNVCDTALSRLSEPMRGTGSRRRSRRRQTRPS
ncbi:Bifunctional epoxide hydrolase 2 [Fusarium oxysporum f. sp. raphani]|uniref:Bifunctional epoxide hydrolase 2 n=1 Tax=Fusarium oxysporum f. sp. raphani TaxID=96318 RepID=A0A8J5P4A5_FUSOX|nr:Bifunctional epoxide hydrolase 2 [Fusarium oxysporum f. sp. raphani]